MGTLRSLTCPSGLKGEVRGLKTREANILADSGGARRGTTFDSILRACWMGTEDAAIYATDAGGGLDWSKVLVCDRLYTLIQVRVATYGPEYAFDYQCSNTACRTKIAWEIDLEKDLVVRALSDASRDQLRKENKFATRLASTDRGVFFKLTTGADEVKAATSRGRGDKIMTTALAARIVSIDGVEGNDRIRFLDDLELDDARQLIEAMDDADGGIDTEIEVECNACQHIQMVNLPFGREFYLPSKKRKPDANSTA